MQSALRYKAKPLKSVSGLVVDLTAHFDASLGCAGSSTDGFARQGAHFFVALPSLRVPPALWLSKSGIQSTISISTCESELTSATSCAKELVGIRTFVREILPYCVLPVSIMRGDNSAANSIGNCLAGLRRVRHLSLQALWVRMATSQGQVKIDFISTAQNTADLLTKVLGSQVLDVLLDILSIFVLHSADK